MHSITRGFLLQERHSFHSKKSSRLSSMPFFRSLLFYCSAGASAFLGYKFLDGLPNKDLLMAILPVLFLFASHDLWMFITRGTIDGLASFTGQFLLMRRSYKTTLMAQRLLANSFCLCSGSSGGRRSSLTDASRRLCHDGPSG